MKLFITFILLIFSICLIGSGTVFVLPYYFYNQYVNKNYSNNWYGVSNYSKALISPSSPKVLSPSKTKNERLWRKFQFGDLKIPLPVKNPFYFVTPKLKFNKKNNKTSFGLSINNSEGRSLVDVYYLPNRKFPSYLTNQDLFDIPILKKEILKANQERIWSDSFTKSIDKWRIPLKEMIYNLYLLEFRSRLIGPQAIDFGLFLNTNKAYVTLNHFNNDYTSEIIFTKKGGQIFSFLLITAKNNSDAELLRYKLIDEIEYLQSIPLLTKIIYKEYKALKYRDKIDHTGMLYLLSAWSHDESKVNILKEAISNLERGERNEKVLESIYNYSYKRFGRVFSTKKVQGLNLDSNVILKRNIEIEERESLKVINEQKIKAPTQTTIEDDYEKIIQKAKQNRLKTNRIELD